MIVRKFREDKLVHVLSNTCAIVLAGDTGDFVTKDKSVVVSNSVKELGGQLVVRLYVTIVIVRRPLRDG